MSSTLTRAVKLALVKMAVSPRLDYGDVIYRSADKCAVQKLEVRYHYFSQKAIA